MDNPLVATPNLEKTPWAGIWIAEDVELIHQGVTEGSWIDGGLGLAGFGLDALAFVSDPIGNLLQYGLAWLIEHVQPLSDALDWLAGNPAVISAQAQTWRNVAVSMRTQADSLVHAMEHDLGTWSGLAATAYRDHMGGRARSLATLGRCAETMAVTTEVAGILVGSVREMIRDAIATLVSRLITYAAELVATVGFAAPLVIEQVATTCAAWAARIAGWLKSLIRSLGSLLDAARRLSRHADDLGDLTRRTGDGPGTGRPAPDGDANTRPDSTAGTHDEPGDPGDRNGDDGPPALGDPGFDPAEHRGALGEDFAPGVHDPYDRFQDKERDLADRLEQEGERVDARFRDESVEGRKMPDAMVRNGPDDPGTVTEFKTPDRLSVKSITRSILEGAKQVGEHGGGNVVIDGRQVGLTEEIARQGYEKAMLNHRLHGSVLPDTTRVILGDDRIIDLP